jgi:hypothetical protein
MENQSEAIYLLAKGHATLDNESNPSTGLRISNSLGQDKGRAIHGRAQVEKGDQVLVSSGHPFPGQRNVPISGSETPTVVFSVGHRHGRGGGNTLIYVELKGGKRGTFRALDVSPRQSG